MHSIQRNAIYSISAFHQDQSYEQPDDDFDNTAYNNSRIFLFCPNGYITQEKKSDGQVKLQTQKHPNSICIIPQKQQGNLTVDGKITAT